MAYSSVEIKRVAHAVIVDGLIKKLIFKRNNDDVLELDLADPDAYILKSNRDGAHAHLAAAQTGILVNAVTPVLWTAIDNDPNDMLTQGVANIMIRESGLYDLQAYVAWDSATGTKTIYFYVNGVSIEATQIPTGVVTDVHVLDYPLEEDDIVTIRVSGSSGTRSLIAGRLSIRRTGDPFG